MQLWLEVVMYIWFALSAISFIIVIIDIPSKSVGMPIMKIVWPLTTLYMGIAGLYAYWKFGRNTPMMHHGHEGHHDDEGHHAHHSNKPFWQSVFVSSTHCGGGCALGDTIGGNIKHAM